MMDDLDACQQERLQSKDVFGWLGFKWPASRVKTVKTRLGDTHSAFLHLIFPGFFVFFPPPGLAVRMRVGGLANGATH